MRLDRFTELAIISTITNLAVDGLAIAFPELYYS
jgi:hypothetical protein